MLSVQSYVNIHSTQFYRTVLKPSLPNLSKLTINHVVDIKSLPTFILQQHLLADPTPSNMMLTKTHMLKKPTSTKLMLSQLSLNTRHTHNRNYTSQTSTAIPSHLCSRHHPNLQHYQLHFPCTLYKYMHIQHHYTL